jgi:hypothetical protein
MSLAGIVCHIGRGNAAGDFVSPDFSVMILLEGRFGCTFSEKNELKCSQANIPFSFAGLS